MAGGCIHQWAEMRIDEAEQTPVNEARRQEAKLGSHNSACRNRRWQRMKREDAKVDDSRRQSWSDEASKQDRGVSNGAGTRRACGREVAGSVCRWAQVIREGLDKGRESKRKGKATRRSRSLENAAKLTGVAAIDLLHSTYAVATKKQAYVLDEEETWTEGRKRRNSWDHQNNQKNGGE